LATTFLLLVISSLNFPDVCQHILYKQEQNVSLIRQKTNIFPKDPHYNEGSMEKFLIVCRIQMNFRFWLYKKR